MSFIETISALYEIYVSRNTRGLVTNKYIFVGKCVFIFKHIIPSIYSF